MKKMILGGLILGMFLLILVQGVQAAETYQLVAIWGSPGTADGQFNTTEDIAVDTLGNVYVSDRNNHRIQKFSPDGTYLGQWGGSGPGAGEFNYTGSIAVDNSGNVYVADEGNNRTQKFTSAGAYLTQWPLSGSLAVDSSGNVYIGSRNRISKFTSEGVLLTQFGPLAPVSDLAVDSSGHLYTASWDEDHIYTYSPNGTSEGYFTVEGPCSITLDSTGNIYVGLRKGEMNPPPGNHRVQKYAPNRSLLAEWGGYGTGDGQFNNPYGIAVDFNGNVYVADTGNNRIQKFSGTLLAKNTGIFRPANGNWYLDYNKDGVTDTSFRFGKSGDIPVPGDWNGDGITDAGIYRSSSGNWYLDYNKDGVVDTSFQFGKSGDMPAAGDWNGDGIMDAGIFRPSSGIWYLDYNRDGVTNISFQFGKWGDTPVSGKWN